ncbi:MAG: hypothetical protein ACRDTG_29660, partial [Pseudonocardiaceae bacterium]
LRAPTSIHDPPTPSRNTANPPHDRRGGAVALECGDPERGVVRVLGGRSPGEFGCSTTRSCRGRWICSAASPELEICDENRRVAGCWRLACFVVA